jgi:hypothetical protein
MNITIDTRFVSLVVTAFSSSTIAASGLTAPQQPDNEAKDAAGLLSIWGDDTNSRNLARRQIRGRNFWRDENSAKPDSERYQPKCWWSQSQQGPTHHQAADASNQSSIPLFSSRGYACDKLAISR